MGWGAKFVDDLSSGFHGEPVAAVITNNAVHGPTEVAFSSALIYAGVPEHPEGHDMVVQSLRVFAYQK